MQESYARHISTSIPYNWKEAINESLDKDVEQGIIVPVPAATLTEWCALLS